MGIKNQGCTYRRDAEYFGNLTQTVEGQGRAVESVGSLAGIEEVDFAVRGKRELSSGVPLDGAEIGRKDLEQEGGTGASQAKLGWAPRTYEKLRSSSKVLGTSQTTAPPSLVMQARQLPAATISTTEVVWPNVGGSLRRARAPFEREMRRTRPGRGELRKNQGNKRTFCHGICNKVAGCDCGAREVDRVELEERNGHDADAVCACLDGVECDGNIKLDDLGGTGPVSRVSRK